MLGAALSEVPKDMRDFSPAIASARLFASLPVPFLTYSQKCQVLWRQLYRYVRQRYLTCLDLTDYANTGNPSNGRIWVMWWQGEEKMPDIIRACYRQLLSVAGGREVNLITEKNYRDWVDIPERILDRFYSGCMSITHLSDTIRCYLLRDWGGLWIDSSVFARDLDFDWDAEFYTLRTHGQLTDWFSQGDWSTFVLYCRRSGSVLMRNMCILYERYWSDHDRALVYEMPDYFIRLIYDSSASVRCQIDSVPDSFDYRTLLGIMNKPYDQEEMDCVLERCPLQKMSYKFKVMPEVDGRVTNFGYLLQRQR